MEMKRRKQRTGKQKRLKHRKRKKILFVYITHRMPAMEAKKERNVRQQTRKPAARPQHEHRMAVREAEQEQTPKKR